MFRVPQTMYRTTHRVANAINKGLSEGTEPSRNCNAAGRSLSSISIYAGLELAISENTENNSLSLHLCAATILAHIHLTVFTTPYCHPLVSPQYLLSIAGDKNRT